MISKNATVLLSALARCDMKGIFPKRSFLRFYAIQKYLYKWEISESKRFLNYAYSPKLVLIL